MPAGSRVMVSGRLAFVGAYGCDAFALTDSRSNWLVQAVAPADQGDTMLDVTATVSTSE